MSLHNDDFDPEKYAVSGDDEFDPEQYAIKDEENRSFLSKLPANILTGLAEMGHGLINAPHNIANLVSPEIASHIPKQQEYDYASMLGLPQNPTMADKIVRGVAQYAPTALIPAGEASLIPRVGAQAIKQGAFGATQNENPIKGAEEGAIAGAGGELLSSGIEGLLNALRPSRMLRGNLTKEELQKNLESTEGTNTSLGRALESPTLNRVYENILPHVIGSGAEDVMQKTAGQIGEKGTTLLEKIRGDINPGDTGVQLQSAMKQAASAAREEKNKGFEKLNKFADESGLKVGRENLQNTASNVIKDIELSPELKAEFGKDLFNDLERYAANPEGNTLKLTNIFRGKLGDKANELYQAGKMHEYGIVNSLKEALSKDIDESFERSENPALKSAYEKNQQDYIEKFAPFEDKDIVKFTRQGGDPDLILPHFLRGGKNDRATILSKLTNLPQQDKTSMSNMLSYAHLSKAIDENGKVDPMKLSTLYRNLGEKQKEALIPSESTRSELDKFTNLVGKNKESFDLMRNPKTGARNTDLIIKLAQIATGTTLGLPGLAALAGGGLAGKVVTKALTSEKTRTNLIKKMIEDKKMKIPGRAAIPGLMELELNEYKGTK